MHTETIIHHEIGSNPSYIHSSAHVHGLNNNNYLLIQLIKSLFLYVLLFSLTLHQLQWEWSYHAYEGVFQSFPSYYSKLSYRIKEYHLLYIYYNKCP